MVALDRRIGWIFVAFLVLLGAALLRALDLGVINAGSLQQAAISQQITRDVIPATRGTITDRSGVELALSESADKVVADDFLIKHPEAVAAKLAPLLGESMMTVEAQLSKRDGYVPLAYLLPADTATQIMKLQINGISEVPEVTRAYPRDWLASQLLGFVHRDGQGASGLEYRYNKQLEGTNGLRTIVNDAIGQPISIDDQRTMQPGKTLRLTIDAALQDQVEQVLAGVGAQYSPKGATAIVMNPNTGAILALANWPRVNANDPSAAPAYADQNQAVMFNYEPGSTFKAITVAGALQDGLVTPNTNFNIPPVLQVADRQIHDAEAHGWETLSVAGILKVLEQHRRRPDRREARPVPLQLLGSPVRLRVADRRRPARRGRRHHPAGLAVLGLVDGQPAVRPGRVGDADADRDRLRGDRQRRHPAAAAHRRRRSAASPSSSRPATGSSPSRPRSSCARC